jgi:chromosome partitioning protein
MRRIAFTIQKGGTGKTTLAGNTAFALAKKSKTVLIDGDPQGNTSSWLLKEAPPHELADVLLGTVALEQALVPLTPKLSILPTFGVDGSLQQFADTKMVSQPFVFDDLCDGIAKLDFDFAIFDLSPGMSLLERYVILAMDEVITPLTPEFFSLDGIQIFSNELRKINANYRRKVRHDRIVANMVNKSFRRHTAIYEQFTQLDFELFTVGQDAKLAESQLYHQSIFEYCPESKAVPEIEKLAKALREG